MEFMKTAAIASMSVPLSVYEVRLELNKVDITTQLSHPGTITAPDDTASPVRSEEELYSVTPDTAAPDVSTAESSASEEQSVDHTLHNLKVNNSSQSLLLIPSIPARTRSNAWETASISDGVLHQRQAQRAERDP